VRAVNREGEGANLESSLPIIAKNPYDEPAAPSVPEIVDWDKVKTLSKKKNYFINLLFNNFSTSRIELI
jgi:hypothetical protein